MFLTVASYIGCYFQRSKKHVEMVDNENINDSVIQAVTFPALTNHSEVEYI